MAAARESALAKLPTAAKAGIVLVVFVLVAVGYYVIFYSEISGKITSETNREKTLRDDLGKATQAQVAYQKDLAELHEREQRRAEIEKVLPSQSEYPSFLSSIQGVANVSGVSLTAWAPEPEKAEEFYARVPMKLKLSGRYHQVAKFFFSVGELDRIINMENISITNPVAKADEVEVAVEVQATAFRTTSEQDVGDKTKKRGAVASGAAGGGK